MKTKASEAGHIYLYAVVPGMEERELGISGLFDSAVHTISEDDLTAVVSEVPATEKLRPERKHLAATQKVLSHLVKTHDVVLPVSFGTVADSAKGIREMLRKYSKELGSQIKRVSGKVEMELRAVYEVPNVFEYLVGKYEELKQDRDRIYESNREPTREEKINLGQHFEQVQSQEREELTAEMEKRLGSSCSEVKRNKPRNEKEVMRISCLIDKDGVEGFQNALAKASGNLDDNLVIEFNGPLPPYNFVEIRVNI